MFSNLPFGLGQQSQNITNCRIDLKKTYQVIDNFGASDCWSTQFIGNWPDEKRNAIADLLFSQKVDSSGKPLGIGLSLWRFNIGAGSTEQGAASSILSDWRRSECFLNSDGSYNWDKQAGQLWFLKAAKQRGVNQFLGFTNSAPVFFTKNGLAFNKGRDSTYNIKPEKFEAYADFLSHVIAGIKKKLGVELNYVSPFNEPEWDWNGNSQEGSPVLISELAKEVKLLDKKLSDNHLNTNIIVTESGKLDYLFKEGTDKPGRDNQIEELFNPKSSNFIGNSKHVPHLIAGHAYWTTIPVTTMIGKRKELHTALQKKNLKYWQTEVCLMEDVPGIGNGHGRDLTMKTALYFARLIYYDMVISNASAWQWWLAISNGDYKDGLIFVMPQNCKTDGTYTDSKLLWTLGNYSRFLRPGTMRVDVSAPGKNIQDPEGLMISVYHNTKAKQIVIVAVNYSAIAEKVKFEVADEVITGIRPYVTSDKPGDDLRPYKPFTNEDSAEIPARSVVTFVCSCK